MFGDTLPSQRGNSRQIGAKLGSPNCATKSPFPELWCARWNWHNARGRVKDMAARTLLLKLDTKLG